VHPDCVRLGEVLGGGGVLPELGVNLLEGVAPVRQHLEHIINTRVTIRNETTGK
jgi:hypothetical protein